MTDCGRLTLMQQPDSRNPRTLFIIANSVMSMCFRYWETGTKTFVVYSRSSDALMYSEQQQVLPDRLYLSRPPLKSGPRTGGIDYICICMYALHAYYIVCVAL